MKKICFILLFILLFAGCGNTIESGNFESQQATCRKSDTTIELTSKTKDMTDAYKTYKVPSDTDDKLYNFYCNTETSSIKANYGGTVSCSKNSIISKYTIMKNIKEAIQELETDDYYCFLYEESNSTYLDELVNNNWCYFDKGVKKTNYYTFDNEGKAYNNYPSGLNPYEYEYKLSNDILDINYGGFDLQYKYNPTNHHFEFYSGGKSDETDYLEICDKQDFSNVRINFYVKSGQNYTLRYNVSKYDNLTFTHYECTNGNTGKWDNDNYTFIPDQNIDSTCNIYFDK